MGILDPDDIDKYANKKLKFLPIFILFIGTVTLSGVAAYQYLFKNWTIGSLQEISPTPTEILTQPGEVQGEEIGPVDTIPVSPTPTKFVKPKSTNSPTKVPTTIPTLTPTLTPTPTITPTPTGNPTQTPIPTNSPVPTVAPTATQSATIVPTP